MPNNKKDKEKVMAVERSIVFKDGYWQGLRRENLDYYLDLIRKNYKFKARNEIENDSSWQQIIPYIVFNFQDKYFLYRYLEKAGEKRLKNEYILGLGGHINPVRLAPGQDILESEMMREWKEEVEYKGNLIERKLIGILNDDRRPVEASHLGLVWLFVGDSPALIVKEKNILKGRLVKLADFEKYMVRTSNWAEIVWREYLQGLSVS